MKELSIEQKAQRYDEAIDIARKINSGEGVAAPSGWTTCEVIFPELKENEDEKIRKALIRAFKSLNTIKVWNGIERTDILAWLEKQGEQKPLFKKGDTVFWDGEEFDILDVTKDSYDVGGYIIPICRQNELLLKQKPADKVEPKFRIGDFVKNTNYQGEPIYEIVYMDKECYICEYRGKENMGDKTVMHVAFDNPYLRLVEQKLAWSEEDETRLTNIIIMLKEGASHHFIKDDITKAVDWLKSLRPQNTWKPSDEQIKALHDLNLTGNISYPRQGQELIDLYNELKKLK